MKARTASAVAWSLCLVSVGLIVATLVIGLLGRSPMGFYGQVGGLTLATFPLVGALIASRRPKNPIGWIFCAVGLSFGLSSLATGWSDYALIREPGALPFGSFFSWVATWVWPPGILLLFTFVLLLFPDGRLLSRRWRPVAWIAAFDLIALIVPVAITAWPIRGPLLSRISDDAPAAAPQSFKVAYSIQVFGILLMFVLGLVSAASLIVRWRRARGDERQQIKWFAFAGAVLVVVVILASPLFHIGDQLQVLTFPLIPVASAIAILKYRLYDIDLVIRRTVVFGVIAVFITAVYMALVVGPILLLGGGGDRPSVVLSAVAAAVVAVAFQPIRLRAQRFANRLVYGKRATPYEVLSEFSERMGETYAAEDVLPRMARIMGEGTGASRAQVWLRTGPELRRAASWPDGEGPSGSLPVSGDALPAFEGAALAVPVRHQGQLLAALTVTKPSSEPITPAEEKLVADLAAQAGLVLRNVALIDDLRASRQRLVAAQDEERRRLERNLHDGAQQQLVALAVKQRIAEGLAHKDPDAVARILSELQKETGEALENLRDLARGIYPPLLADRGLPDALAAQSRKAAIPVELQAESIGRYPQDIEAAVYFCCLEAMQNVAKYAHASRGWIRLVADDDHLRFEVEDDGAGFDPGSTGYGTGLQGMSDRLEAGGGTLDIRSQPGHGTTVIGRIPVPSMQPIV
ncbi:MAG: sensor histidine kinase [Actinomycetota bacterium]|nr:sensor histidine kinase [Actinomycetota bacterium]